MQENNYLGTEKAGRLLLQFAVPSTLALIISCLYNIVDQIFVGNGIGYAVILVIVGFFRELLGSGTLLGYQVIPQSFYNAGYVNNGLMILPPMALILVACIIWVQRSYNKDLQED